MNTNTKNENERSPATDGLNECICGKPVSVCEAPIPKGEFDRQKAIDAITVPSREEVEASKEKVEASTEKTYTVHITYMVEIESSMSKEDIENELFMCADIGFAEVADAVDYEIEVME